VTPDGFLADLEAKPTALAALADALDDVDWPVPRANRVMLTGMGSSWFAAETAARRMRAAGVHATAELASAETLCPPARDLTMVGITAGGTSPETLRHLDAHRGRSLAVALTNNTQADLPADATVFMHAGEEAGGVACRSFTHTLVQLLHLEHQLAGSVPGLPGRVARAAAAVDHLLATRDQWLDTVQHELRGAHGTWLLAPAERYANSLQGALMVREGPRRVADGCETGDWCHVDVYLTKTLDYRALLCTGSRYDEVAVRWLRDRHSRFVAVGGPVPGAAHTVRYPGDDDPVVALLTEVLVAELVAATWWADVS